MIIALLVLLPETIAALRSARRDRVQTSLNLALGSAMASIGLTIPAVALASIWLSGPLVLGLGSTHMVLLGLTVVVSSLTVVPGRATPLQGGVHLVVFAGVSGTGDQSLDARASVYAAPAFIRWPAPPPPPAPAASREAARSTPG